jgi:hypothetical protein
LRCVTDNPYGLDASERALARRATTKAHAVVDGHDRLIAFGVALGRTPVTDDRAYKQRNLTERFFSRLKDCAASQLKMISTTQISRPLVAIAAVIPRPDGVLSLECRSGPTCDAR